MSVVLTTAKVKAILRYFKNEPDNSMEEEAHILYVAASGAEKY